MFGEILQPNCCFQTGPGMTDTRGIGAKSDTTPEGQPVLTRGCGHSAKLTNPCCDAQIQIRNALRVSRSWPGVDTDQTDYYHADESITRRHGERTAQAIW